MVDDRDVSVGEKFTDADLLGIPFRLVVGGKVPEGKVEVKERGSGEIKIIGVDELF
ncbi:MAG: prolyl-tRNA synthetase [Candidatus Berkelbacteria bacterium Licking1014_85]|uniref:Prolyl-tRNA synthetase n=1 Tax=Candidatus Berkelbacteria bacterium Licking1014_85 TaxID=2017148 RepID=A0A554LJT5_9BACT|nr:MAG: prolyl-tRNA synthetase [Candidatus Berkelbacteria bacterium Licking1014_85]